MSPRIQLLGAITVGVVIMIGSVLFVRQELTAEIAATAASEKEAHDKLSKKIGVLEGRIAAVESQPQPDISGIELLRGELGALKETVANQETKLGALEKAAATPVAQPAKEAAAEPSAAKEALAPNALATAITSGAAYQKELAQWDKAHPGMETKFPILRQQAASGVPTETQLRVQFREILTGLETPAQPTDAPKLMQRINTHLAGLVSIKKTGETKPDYTQLRSIGSDASLEAMVVRVDMLSSTAQMPFVIWRETVRTRAAALAELSSLTGGV